MKTLDIVLYILAAVCFLLSFAGASAEYGPGDRRRSFNLISLGLLFWVLVPLIALFK